MAGVCTQGKFSWPELVGARATDAAIVIERENPFVKAEIIGENVFTVLIIICTRVYVRVDANGIVTRIPTVG